MRDRERNREREREREKESPSDAVACIGASRRTDAGRSGRQTGRAPSRIFGRVADTRHDRAPRVNRGQEQIGGGGKTWRKRVVG